MGGRREPDELDVLAVFVDEMESRGESNKTVILSIDEKFTEAVSQYVGGDVPVSRVHELADKCLAHEWIEQRAAAQKYGAIGITTTGVGVIRSKRRQEKRLAERSRLKKMSDYIVDHRGILIAAGASIALLSLIIRLFTL